MKKEDLFFAILENDVAKVKVLLENGVSANVSDLEEKTALMHAESEEIIMLLMQNEADIRARDRHGRTALMHAALMGRRSGVTRMLITCGATVNAKDSNGMTALMHAADQGHAKIVRILLQNGANVNVISDGALSALVRAAHNGHLDVVRMLLENGADVNHAMTMFYAGTLNDEENKFMASILDKWLITVALGSQRELTSQEKTLIQEQEKRDWFIGQEIKFQASLNNRILLHVIAHAEKSIERWLDLDYRNGNVDAPETNAAFKGAYKRISNEFATEHFCALEVRRFENKIGYRKIKKKYFEISPNIACFSASISDANLSNIEDSCRRISEILSDEELSLSDVQFALDFINFDYLQSVQNSEFYSNVEWMRCPSFVALLEQEKAAEKGLLEKMVEKSGVEICSSATEEGFVERVKRKEAFSRGCMER